MNKFFLESESICPGLQAAEHAEGLGNGAQGSFDEITVDVSRTLTLHQGINARDQTLAFHQILPQIFREREVKENKYFAICLNKRQLAQLEFKTRPERLLLCSPL